MTKWKVVKQGGVPVCFGPNDGNYDPALQPGQVLEIVEDMPSVPVPHARAVRDEADALQNSHITDAQVTLILVRAVRLLGKAVLNGGALTPGEKTIAGHALAASEWAANVQKERDRAIADGNDPVWPTWDNAWDVIFDHI